MLKQLPKVGDRVMYLPLRIKGTITYVDYPHLKMPHFYAIQIQLDKPWDPDNSPQRTIRANPKELRKLKKRRKGK